MMVPSKSEFFLSFTSSVASFGQWLWAVPKKFVEFFSWFSSRKMDVPDTEQGRRLKQALHPDSLFDKLAKNWAYAPFWTKVAMLGWTTLFFGLLGLAVGGTIVLSIASMVLGLSIHGLLVTHHDGRVKRITRLVTEQEVLREGIRDTLNSVQGEVNDFIQIQKSENQASFDQFKKDAQDLANAVLVVDEQVAEVVLTNKQLAEVGKHIQTTLHEVDEQAIAWNKGLAQHQEILSTVIDASHTFSGLVQNVTNNYKAFDTMISQLHEAVIELTKPLEKSDIETFEEQIDSSAYTHQPDQTKEQFNAFDAQSKQHKEYHAKNTDLSTEDSLLMRPHKDNELLAKLTSQRTALTAQRAKNEAKLQRVVGESTTYDLYGENNDMDSVTSYKVESTNLAWLKTVRQSISARQERMVASRHDRLAHQNTLEDHQTVIHSIESDIIARSEQRKLRRAHIDAACRFFVEPACHADLDNRSRLSISVQ